MIKDQIVDAVVAAAEISRPEAVRAVEAILEAMSRHLAQGARVELRGFGTLLVKPRRRGIGRDPRHPTVEIPIRPGFTVRFKPGKALRGLDTPRARR